MSLIQWGKRIICLALLINHSVHAGEITLKDSVSTTTVEEAEPKSMLPTETVYANWIFSGMATNENGGHYGYFFQVQRNNNTFHALSAVFDSESKRILLFDESSATIHEPKTSSWQIGRAFLSFNPINESWIFGFKIKNKEGFNFKVDMLSHPENTPVIQDLRSGMELLVSQTGRLNGHLQIGEEEKEQFVTAKNAWYRHVWLTKDQETSHPFSSLLCRFNDGSGLYSVNVPEEDAFRGAVAGLCDAQGASRVISQFIDIKKDKKEDVWHIRIPSPALHLVLSETINQNSVVAGFISKGEKTGFCLLSKDKLGESTASQPEPASEHSAEPKA
ncbi:hypothetical protein [Legionella oakridgensis]|uniref:Uncharacterized protein n=2 Tax=Legionella oakridgensis TaxID=29423 RepID=W0BB17_9GAMM|nr:hypothetical protein [Legionella oakridgensis]AHE67733.1 hypothetical protein Loa_02191 [Legionella oakridgensis ATCC 33761 = DSM 21215]ETO92696.1 hypothetical protein LOR_40c04800 [Legionella oakridgensis RV-2-2007]KTD36937.1 hypothetical protein Loak_2073 [Legionella oakridgensis]STY20754.1 Uncharacterised protein [Legionella longbeachae]